MKKNLISFLFIMIFSSLTFGLDEYDSYMEALRKEINNRALAAKVVPVLAKKYKDSSQGEFWQAYANFEEKQSHIYIEKGLCYDIKEDTFINWIKAKGSIVFAQLFNDTFIAMMSNSTSNYLNELLEIEPTDTGNEKFFWMYVIAQEKIQVLAFEKATNRDFTGAAKLLNDFSKDIDALYHDLIKCQ